MRAPGLCCFDILHPRRRTSLVALGLLVIAGCGGGSGSGGGVVDTSVVPDFELRTDVLLSGGGLSDALLADLNGDGWLDLVESGFSDRTVSVGMGDGQGEFTTVAVLDVDGFPARLAIGDVDADGVADIAVIVVNQSATEGPCDDCSPPALVLLQQDASGIYEVTASLELADLATDVLAAPLSGGAADDLLVALPERGECWLVQLVGPGVLAVGSVLETEGATRPISLAVVDDDGDLVLDLVAGEFGPAVGQDRVALYRGQGPGDFEFDRTLVSLASSPIVRNAGDVDSDGFEDVSVAQLEATTARLLLGSAVGLGAPLSVDFGAGQSTVLFRDLSGDGLAEAAATLFEEGAIEVLTPSSPLGWATGAVEYYNVGAFPRALAAPDFGGDGRPDLFCSNARDTSIVLNKGGGAFHAARGYPLGTAPAFVGCGDFDGNGTLDVVSLDLFQRAIVFMTGVGDGTFELAGTFQLEESAMETPGFLALDDLDSDGDLDLAATVYATGQLQILHNEGSLPFGGAEESEPLVVGTRPLGLDSADVNGDGERDIVVANSDDHTVQVVLGQGGGAFAVQPAFSVPARPLAILLEDLTGDARIDLVVTTGAPSVSGGASVLVFHGDGAGSFVLADQVPLNEASAVVASGDFDEDGRLDLAAAQTSQVEGDVFVLLNRGDLGYERITVSVGIDPGTLEVADVDLDGHLDLIVPLGTGELRLALGDGAGSFTVAPLELGELPVPFGTNASTYEDVDGDGRPDLLLVSGYSPFLWVARNISAPLAD